MKISSQDAAKFLSGIAFHESLGHWWLGIWGKDMLPWKFSWFTFTAEINMFAMIAWPIVLVALVWYAWIRVPRMQTA